ncbi:hypothetical protein G4Y79_09570 [Phototrophicus methaneseepsis]|uniref:Uncharacterized protein n=1 Tax=Phototrophicus methaneseepsis TaxID=2710758 RepID=A0A7S8ED21_9CHLR|nr:hypothetical protein [Phototrophicus methaneseepsis]QPC84604.1 hypothetical protein G4Y79_09570 [Phototrophicus methaneseepsis]
MSLLKSRRILYILPIIVLLLVFIVVFSQIYPVGVDWLESFHSPGITQFRDHYKITDYEGVGWALFFLPHIFLPLELGNVINFILNITLPLLVIRKYRGSWLAIAMTFTSPMFFDLMRTNNVDWLALVGFLLPAGWGITFLLTKPQVASGAALVIWKRNNFHIKYLIPLVILAGLSFLVFGNWLADLNSEAVRQSPWNFAPFPYMIPLGLYLLYEGWKADDEVIAAASTPFLMPYVAPYSFAGLLAVVAAKYPKSAAYVYIGFWCYFIIQSHRMDVMGIPL